MNSDGLNERSGEGSNLSQPGIRLGIPTPVDEPALAGRIGPQIVLSRPRRTTGRRFESFLYLAAFVAVFIAWFAILLTGRYPRGLFDFVVGVCRYSLRVAAYAFLLVTDEYPPFSLS